MSQPIWDISDLGRGGCGMCIAQAFPGCPRQSGTYQTRDEGGCGMHIAQEIPGCPSQSGASRCVQPRPYQDVPANLGHLRPGTRGLWDAYSPGNPRDVPANLGHLNPGLWGIWVYLGMVHVCFRPGCGVGDTLGHPRMYMYSGT